MQNNRFHNTLMIKQLRNSYVYEKYLQTYSLFQAIKQCKRNKITDKKVFSFGTAKQQYYFPTVFPPFRKIIVVLGFALHLCARK